MAELEGTVTANGLMGLRLQVANTEAELVVDIEVLVLGGEITDERRVVRADKSDVGV